MKYQDNLIKILKSLYLHQRFFITLFSLAAGFLFSFWIPWLFLLIWVLTVIFLITFIYDCFRLFGNSTITGQRELPKKFSNSDENQVKISLRSSFPFEVEVELIDEIPVQFQKRNFLKRLLLKEKGSESFSYFLRPVERGEYFFGNLNIFCSSKLNLAKRRIVITENQMVKVYPSIIQMKKYEFLAIDNKINQPGLKKIRRIGHTMEFEQIKNYTFGDDLRTINWKATAKHGEFMVNQYQDEKSQPVYSLIDTGRTMKMPFNGLSLLDYSINSCLAFSNIVLRKKDKAGLFAFSNEPGIHVTAAAKISQLNLILEQLYNIKTKYLDTDFGLLYGLIKRKITRRSLLLLYTNFEHISSLNRQLPFLKAIAKKHLLVVILFENTELTEIMESSSNSIPAIFDQTIAEQMTYEKRQMIIELQKHGIQAILSKPEELNIKTINKYLEIKKRGIL